MKYEHDIRAIRRVDGNISYWIAKSQQLPGCLGRGSSVEEAIQNLIDPKGNTNGAKGLSDYTLRSLRIEDESDSEKRQGLAEKLQAPSVFCGDCKNYGEPNGCNRDGGYCVAWGLAQDAADILGGREQRRPKRATTGSAKRQFPLLRPSFCIFCRKPSENVAHSLRSCLRSGIIQYTKQ